MKGLDSQFKEDDVVWCDLGREAGDCQFGGKRGEALGIKKKERSRNFVERGKGDRVKANI